MMGRWDRDQGKLFYEFRLDDMVPVDHFLRRMDVFVTTALGDPHAQLKPFYSDIGRPSVDPELMIRMLLVGYCYSIRSERRLCRLDLEDRIPHHSTIPLNRLGRFRESDILRHIFEHVVVDCMATGLVKGEDFAVDASVFEANASRYHCKPPSELDWTDAQKQRRAVAEYLATASPSGLMVSFASTTPAVCTVSGTTASILTAGTCSITATQAGDGNYNAATPVVQSFTINVITTKSTVISSINPSLVGQPVTFTANVSPTTATGTVTFRDGAAVLGTGTVTGGVATLTVSTLAAGAHAITATYDGDTNHATAASPVLPHTVTPNGTVSLAVATSEGDGTFNFSSGAALLNTSVTTASGTGQTPAYSLNPGIYTVTVALPDGFGLTAVSCSDADSSGSVSGKTATIVLAPAEAVTCTFTSANSRKKTVEVISRFMSRRNDMLLSNGPDPNRQIDRLIEAGGGKGSDGAGAGDIGGNSAALGGPANGPSRLANSDGTGNGAAITSATGNRAGVQGTSRSFEERLGELRGSGDDGDQQRMGLTAGRLSGSTDGTTRFSFATSLSQMLKASADAEKRKVQGLVGDKAMGLGAHGGTFGPKPYSPFDIWFEGQYQSFADDRDRANSDGHFGVVYLGADYIVSPHLLVGALVQWDSMEQRSNTEAFSIRGHGWMAGPYATVRLSENVFLQARSAWGRSTNKVSPFLTYTDNFETRRWLTTATLAGRWKHAQWEVRPTATLAYIEDVSDAYTDSLGVLIPGIKTSLGQLKAGPEISYRYELGDGTTIEPRLGLQAIWNFAGSSDQVVDFGGTLSGPEEVRGRVEIGFRAKARNGLGLDISGSYDGIGSDTFHSIGGKATVRIPLQNE